MSSPPTTRSAKPFLKWAGGKTQILDAILAALPETFGTYFEPFLGGGAVFFGLAPERAVLSDLNAELINAFVVVRDEPEGLIERLQAYEPSKEEFYRVRELRPEDLSPVDRAARTVYLNRTCFNGLYRVNRKGEFNVPYGGPRVGRDIVRADQIRQANAALQGHVIRHADYLEATSSAMAGDLVYLDPPYVPLGGYADFRRYTDDPFGVEDHERLASEFAALADRGVYVVLSNSDTPLTRELYAHWNVRTLTAPRRVSGKTSGRQAVSELLVSNF